MRIATGQHHGQHQDHEHGSATIIENVAHQHAFILVGEQQYFGVHMTQYHCELHKYQVILKLGFPDEVSQQLRELRRKNPTDTFVLCNAKDHHKEDSSPCDRLYRSFSIPELASGKVERFTGNIFQGIRPLSPEEMAGDPHFFPWAKKYCHAAISEFEVTVERIVFFRPFDHLHAPPRFATYLLFGDGPSNEAHMTNLQTARCLSGPFEPPVFGPDYDHVMSLSARPDWLPQDEMLEAGIVVTTPLVELVGPEDGLPNIPESVPFAPGQVIDLMYRGLAPPLKAIAGNSFLYSTAVCNSEDFFMPHPEHHSYYDQLPYVPMMLGISNMPSHYWAYADDKVKQPGVSNHE